MTRYRCLACGCVYWAGCEDAEFCPQRYLSPHTEEFKSFVAHALDDMNLPDINQPSPEQHQAAIAQARKAFP